MNHVKHSSLQFALLAAALAIAGCGPTYYARCDGPASSLTKLPRITPMTQEDEGMLTHFKEAYEHGERDRVQGKPREGAAGYQSVTYLAALEYKDGEGLFEQLPDGDWVYKCNDLTRLYALSAYRLALVRLKYDRNPRAAFSKFCSALRARPDVVLDVVQQEGLPPPARAVFEEARGNPDCFRQEGWKQDREEGTPTLYYSIPHGA